jgi:ureidoglycolate lyase
MTNELCIVPVEPLTAEAFAPFGDVIAAAGAGSFFINNGTTERFHDLAKVETAGEGARTLISIFRGQAFAPPIELKMMERHPLGSQAFVPLSPRPFLVVVAPDEGGKPGVPRVFLAKPDGESPNHSLVGVNYHRNVWHHPLISLEGISEFLVVDRGGEGNNLEECFLDESWRIDSLDPV